MAQRTRSLLIFSMSQGRSVGRDQAWREGRPGVTRTGDVGPRRPAGNPAVLPGRPGVRSRVGWV